MLLNPESLENEVPLMNAILKPEPEINRNLFIGSSDSASIIHVSPWKSEYTLYQEKTGAIIEPVSWQKQKIFNRGKRWEPVVVEMLVDELEDRGHTVEITNRNQRYIHPDYPYLAAEIDLELLMDGEHVTCEMKTVHPFAARDWGTQDTDEIPMYYTAQVLHGMMVTGRTKTIVAGLIGADDLRVHVVYRDEELIDHIRTREIEFWKRVETRNPPPITDLEDIKKIYARDTGQPIQADPAMLAKFVKLQAFRQEIKRIEQQATELEVDLKKFMGECSVLEHEGRPLLTWKNNKESHKTKWKEAFDYLVSKSSIEDSIIREAIKTHSVTTPGARVFKLKENKNG